MQSTKQVMKLDSTKKTCYLFKAPIQETALIKNIYIQKEAFAGNAPTEIVVTVIELQSNQSTT